MRGQDSAESPFSLLANETRLGVVEALGPNDGERGYPSRSYSAVRTALGDVDSGRLNYHLRQIRGRFVEQDEDGYRLTTAGIRVYQALRSDSFDNERRSLDPTELDDDCDVCSEPVTASYERGVFYVRCRACETLYQRYPLSANAVDVTDADELVTVGLLKAHVDSRSMLDGYCPYCSGPVERRLSTEDLGEMNNETEDVFAHLVCTACGWHTHPSVRMVAYHHDSTTTFFSERGVPDSRTVLDVDAEWTTTVRSADPWRVGVETTYTGTGAGKGDSIRHVVDDDLTVLDWSVDGDQPRRSRASPERRTPVEAPATGSDEGPFSVLADETRLGVVRALGDASDEGRYATLSYSELREALAGGGRGNLNYHLRKLRDRFVRKTDDGYRLSTAGIRVYQAVSAGTFRDELPTVDPTSVERQCGACGGSLRVAYRDGRAEVDCPTCGTRLCRSPLSPNAFDPADPEDLLAASTGRARADLRSLCAGVCPYCSGYVERRLSLDDATDERANAVADLRCTLCGWARRPSLGTVVDLHHATTVFYEERDHAPPTRPGGGSDHRVEIRSTDPLRVAVTTRLDGSASDRDGSVRQVVDERLNVVEWVIGD